jgi:GT2 family glycosyltransferase
MPEGISDVAVVIVNYRTPELALRCVEALADECRYIPGLRVVVVDGGSGDESAAMLHAGLGSAKLPCRTELLALTFNGGFGWANNQAILRLLQDQSPPDFIYLLNPDAKIEPGAIAPLLTELQKFPDAAACGSRLLDNDGRILGAAFHFPTPLGEFTRGLRTPKVARLLGLKEITVDSDVPIAVDWVTGASVMLRSEALRQTGLFDDGFFLYFEEVELMWRMRRAGWSVRHVPVSRVLHSGGAATGVGTIAEQSQRRVPDYWYQSRRRFFVLCYGPLRSIWAGVMWLLGHILWLLRAKLQRRDDAVLNEGCDHLRFSFIPRSRDLRRSVPAWNTPPGALPAWQRGGR